MNRQRELAEYFQSRREDDEEWDAEPEEGIVKLGPSTVYSLRLKASDLAELRKAATAQRVSLSELIRTAALTHVRESELSGVEIVAYRVKFFGQDARSAGTKGQESGTATFPLAEATTGIA